MNASVEITNPLEFCQDQLRLINAIALRTNQSIDLQDILKATVADIRQLFRSDRVLVCEFALNGSSQIVAESLEDGWSSLLGTQFAASCFPATVVDAYTQGKKVAINQVEQANLGTCLFPFLQTVDVKAELLVPIQVAGRSWGLLVVHQCGAPRHWQGCELEGLAQIALQLAIAIQQTTLSKQLQTETKERQRFEQIVQASEARWYTLLGHSSLAEPLIDQPSQREICIQEVLEQVAVRQIAENIHEIFYLYNAQQPPELLYISPGYERVWGHSCQSLYDDPSSFVQHVHPRDQGRVIEAFQQQSLGKPIDLEYRIIRSDGAIRWIHDRGFPIRNEMGQVYRLCGVATDITNRKQAELEGQVVMDALHQLNQELEVRVKQRTAELQAAAVEQRWLTAFVENSIDAIVMTTYCGQIIYLNPAARQLIGLAATIDARDLHLSDLYFADDWPELDDTILLTLLKQDVYQSEARLRHVHSGDAIPVLHSIFPIKQSQTEEVIALAAIIRDISDRKQADEQLRNANTQLILTNAELARTTRLKDEFLASMSHELRTPLNAILGLSEGLLDELFGSLNKQQRKFISTIEESGKHLLALINDILDLSKIESGKLELDITAVSVKQLCDSSLTFVRQLAFKKNIQLVTQIPDPIELIQVDDLRTRQMLINLLGNAVKFTPEGGKVTLTVSIETETELEHWEDGEPYTPTPFSAPAFPRICFSVIDTGIGIAPEHMGKLFQSFVQIDSRLSRQYSGTGLGLALVRSIADLHGGQVTVKSVVGKGSCFTVRLPYTPNSNPPIPPPAPTPLVLHPFPAIVKQIPEAEAEAPLILIAEDNPANQEMVCSYLKERGYRVMVATGGEEAIALAKTQRPSLILMDVQMPGMNGLEAVKRLRTNGSAHIPIIALTALAMPDDREKCIQAGVNEYMTKPVQLKQLVEVIQHNLNSPTH